MRRMTAKDFDPRVMELFNEYVHGRVDRRGFIEKASKFASAGASAAVLLELLRPNFALGQQVARDDKRLKTEAVEFDSPQGSGKGKGYLARPASAAGKLPAVLVIHENRGLNPHIEDITRRLALENFMAFAPDALAPQGGYPGDEEKAAALFRNVDNAKAREDFVAAGQWLRARPDGTGRVGVVGFCYGGSMANMLATRMPELAAAVPFYGGQPKSEDVPKINAALLLHFAEKDDWVSKGWPAFEEALKANRKDYTAHHYPGTLHGFNNDTTPRYDEAAAKLAWGRTLAFFNKHLRG